MKERVAVKTAILPAAHQAAKNGHISQALEKQQNDQPHQDAHKAEETNLPITHLHHLQKPLPPPRGRCKWQQSLQHEEECKRDPERIYPLDRLRHTHAQRLAWLPAPAPR